MGDLNEVEGKHEGLSPEEEPLNNSVSYYVDINSQGICKSTMGLCEILLTISITNYLR